MEERVLEWVGTKVRHWHSGAWRRMRKGECWPSPHPFPLQLPPAGSEARGLWALGSLGTDWEQGPFPSLGDKSPGP